MLLLHTPPVKWKKEIGNAFRYLTSISRMAVLLIAILSAVSTSTQDDSLIAVHWFFYHSTSSFAVRQCFHISLQIETVSFFIIHDMAHVAVVNTEPCRSLNIWWLLASESRSCIVYGCRHCSLEYLCIDFWHCWCYHGKWKKHGYYR